MNTVSKKIAMAVATAVGNFIFASQGQACEIDNNAASPNDGYPIMTLNGVPVHHWVPGGHTDFPNEVNTFGHDNAGVIYTARLVDCHTVEKIKDGMSYMYHVRGSNNITDSAPFKTNKAKNK